MPADIGPESDMIDFLNLFLDTEMLNKMVEYTNSRAQQTKTNKPNDYYAQRWSGVTVSEMRAFIGVRLSMEHLLVKPRYADYFRSSHKLLSSSGYRCHRFLAIWKFWHVCDENDPNLNKSNKLYKVRFIIEHMLQKFQHYYSPQ